MDIGIRLFSLQKISDVTCCIIAFRFIIPFALGNTSNQLRLIDHLWPGTARKMCINMARSIHIVLVTLPDITPPVDNICILHSYVDDRLVENLDLHYLT